jgi:hypothetical protein
MKTQAQLIEAVEALVDENDLASVLLALARMCNEKAEHLSFWQDNITARVWDRAATKLDKLIVDSTIETLS